MLLADTYVDRIDFLRYLPGTDCGACGAGTCQEFVEHLKQGRKKPTACPEISEGLYSPFELALGADNLLPKFPCLTTPRPSQGGLVEINSPGDTAPVLVSGNNEHTQDVLTSVVATAQSPFFLLFTDTKGDTVDMALIYKNMTAEQIRQEIHNSQILTRVSHPEIIMPGLASSVADELKKSTGWNIIVGPICAAELPLFFAERGLE